MIYLAARMIAIGFGHRPRRFAIGERHMLVLIGLIFALMGFRLGLNNRDSNVIDVGYASVAGASRLLHGTIPYGHMPKAEGKPCGGHYDNGDPIGYVQSDHRCESPGRKRRHLRSGRVPRLCPGGRGLSAGAGGGTR